MKKLTAGGTKDLIYMRKQQIPTVFIISRSVEIPEMLNLKKNEKKFPAAL